MHALHAYFYISYFITMDNFYNFINQYNINNNQNHRYLIVGSSGSGKTSLALSLILSELPRHKKIYFIIGGDNLILESLKKDFEKNNIKIEIHYINNLQDIENLNIEPKKNDLVFIDDLSHMMKNSKKLLTFINKIFTASRQSKYDVILILHKLKMFNNMARQNATKIFITSLSKDIEDEFPELMDLQNSLPLVIDCLKNNYGGHVIPELNFDKIKFSKDLPVITKDKSLRDRYMINNNKDYQLLKKSSNKSIETQKKEIDKGIKNAITTKPKISNNLLHNTVRTRRNA